MRLVVFFALTIGCAEYDLSEIDDTVAPPIGPELAGPEEEGDGSTSSSGGSGRLVIGLNQLKPGGDDDVSYTSVEDLPGFQTGTGTDGPAPDTDLGIASVGTPEEPPPADDHFGLTPISGGGAGSDQVDISISVGTAAPVDGDEIVDTPPGEEPPQVTPIADWWDEPWEDPPGGPPTDEEIDDLWGGNELARMTGGGHVGDEYSGFDQSFTIHCWWTHTTNNMNVALGLDGRFRMDEVGWIVCLDDPDLDAQQPLPDFDTVVGVVYGTMSTGEHASMWFIYTDNGEPGSQDSARFEIEIDQTTDYIEGEGHLTEGNHQVHEAN